MKKKLLFSIILLQLFTIESMEWDALQRKRITAVADTPAGDMFSYEDGSHLLEFYDSQGKFVSATYTDSQGYRTEYNAQHQIIETTRPAQTASSLMQQAIDKYLAKSLEEIKGDLKAGNIKPIIQDILKENLIERNKAKIAADYVHGLGLSELLDALINLNSEQNQKLFIAIHSGNRILLEKLIIRGMTPDAVNPKKASPNAINSLGKSALFMVLHKALNAPEVQSFFNSLDMARILINNNAQIGVPEQNLLDRQIPEIIRALPLMQSIINRNPGVQVRSIGDLLKVTNPIELIKDIFQA